MRALERARSRATAAARWPGDAKNWLPKKLVNMKGVTGKDRVRVVAEVLVVVVGCPNVEFVLVVAVVLEESCTVFMTGVRVNVLLVVVVAVVLEESCTVFMTGVRVNVLLVVVVAVVVEESCTAGRMTGIRR